MADWSLLECDYYNRFDTYPYNYYQEKDLQPLPAKRLPAQAQPYCSPSPTLTLLLSPSPPAQPPQCTYKPAPIGENPREIRNKAEKQRRDKMNQSIAHLTTIVPTVVKPGRKLDKTSVLRLTAHYLRSHQYVFGNSIDRSPEFSRQFTRGLLNNLKGFLITITYKGLVVVVSENVQEFLGYSEVDLLGQDVLSIIHQDDHQILKDEIYPRSCTLGSNGELLLSKEVDADKKIIEALSKEKRNFIIRFKKMSQQRSDPPQYLTCHVEGSLRKSDRAGVHFDSVVHVGRRVRAKGENPFASGNDIVFIGMVRPSTETFIAESGLESFKMEYRTRHSIDGEIIQCEQRIALVTGYMTQEVNGVNAMNFMHRDDVRWVIIALREMYDQHRLVGESCYRLMTKNGQFIYMRTVGSLDVDKQSKEVTSFVCTNTVVAEHEGQHLIKLMKKKFTLMVNNNEDIQEIEYSEVSDKKTLPVEDPRQLEKVILHLVTNLPSPNPDEVLHSTDEDGISPSRLAIIPPRKERIQKAIEKSYSVIKTLRENDLSSTESIMIHQFHNSRDPEEEDAPPSAFTPVAPTTRNSNGFVSYRPNISNAFCSSTRRNDPEHFNYSFPSIGDMERHLPVDYFSFPSTSQSYSSNLNVAASEQAPNLTSSSTFRPIPTTHTVTSSTSERYHADLVTPEISPVVSPEVDMDSDNVQKILQDFLDNSPEPDDASPVSFINSPFDLFGFSNNNLPTDTTCEDQPPINPCEPVPSTSGIKRPRDDPKTKPTGAKKRKAKKARRSQSTVESETETNVQSLNKTSDSILLAEAAEFCAKSPAELEEQLRSLEAENIEEIEISQKEPLDPYEFLTDSDSA